jgi:hypothetical protein
MKHIETCMVDGLEFTTWANLWMTFPQQNASCYGMLCAGVFPSVNLSRSQVLYKTLIWHEKLSLQMGTLNLRLNRRRLTKLKLPHPFGPWNLWRPFLGCRNIQSFSQFLWVMELTSIHHRFPQHFPMKAPQKRSPLRSPLMMLEWAAWIRAWVCTDVHIWSRRRERRSWIGFNGTVTMIYIMMGFNGYQWDMNGIFILISKFGCTPPKLCLFCNIWNFGCEFVLCRVWPMPSCWIPTGFSCEAQTLNVNLRVNGQSVNPVAPNTFAPGGADDQKKPWPSHGVSPWWKPLENEFHRYLGPV